MRMAGRCLVHDAVFDVCGAVRTAQRASYYAAGHAVRYALIVGAARARPGLPSGLPVGETTRPTIWRDHRVRLIPSLPTTMIHHWTAVQYLCWPASSNTGPRYHSAALITACAGYPCTRSYLFAQTGTTVANGADT